MWKLEVNDCPHKKWLEWQALNLYDITDEVSLSGGMGCSVAFHCVVQLLLLTFAKKIGGKCLEFFS